MVMIALIGVALDTHLTIGSIIEVAVLIIGFVASWFKIQYKSEAQETKITENSQLTKELTSQLQLLSLTVERLSTLAEVNERRWDHIKDK